MKKLLLAAVVAASFIPASQAFAAVAPAWDSGMVATVNSPLAPHDIVITWPQRVCDADGDFTSSGPQGYFQVQVNGVTIGTASPTVANCNHGSQTGYFDIGSQPVGSMNPPLACGSNYTVRVRPIDAAGHAGAFLSVGSSAGAKTFPCITPRSAASIVTDPGLAPNEWMFQGPYTPRFLQPWNPATNGQHSIIMQADPGCDPTGDFAGSPAKGWVVWYQRLTGTSTWTFLGSPRPTSNCLNPVGTGDLVNPLNGTGACNTAYDFSIDYEDAAGNFSYSKQSLNNRTAAC